MVAIGAWWRRFAGSPPKTSSVINPEDERRGNWQAKGTVIGEVEHVAEC